MTNKEAIEILSVIRRSPSVDIFNKLPNSDNIIELNYKGAFDLAIKALEERPQGEWLKSDVPESILAKCSLCGFDCGAYTHNFCPNCGADMRKTESARPDTIGCFNCKYNGKCFRDEPCCVCNNQFSEWDAKR